MPPPPCKRLEYPHTADSLLNIKNDDIITVSSVNIITVVFDLRNKKNALTTKM